MADDIKSKRVKPNPSTGTISGDISKFVLNPLKSLFKDERKNQVEEEAIVQGEEQNVYEPEEVKLDQKHIDLLYSYIKETAYPGYEFEGNTVVKHAKDNQWSLIDHNGVFEEEVLKPAVNKYAEQWGWPMNLKSTHYHDLSFNRFWTRITTNDQYQSLHDHQGVFSFTIWLKIPTDWKDEQEGDAGFAHPEATDFVFTYTDVLGRIQKFKLHLFLITIFAP